ncbi:CDP-alcohol phosphatidyltransferase family protein [Oleisolibacter albus]|uniref:CDP-alcohol phosphatidyltransferase family protein n=1 Tax=Oleisolibacter albus TaxID=2171757 RepID=UPI000DF2F5ED|nr:phosphatidylcholine/phosphatidylserine synthase [Oleisolibacter albus]
MTGARFPWSAWAVHLLTASGAVWAFLALLAVLAGDARACLLWLGLALLVDGIDGPLARRMRVRDRVPLFDGAALDLIVDYLTYVFVPVVFLWKFALLPAPLLLPGCAFILLTSLHLFAKLDMKSADNHFVGFPGIWNVVVLYVVILDTGPWLNAGLVLALGLLTFAPAKFLHPFRVERLRRVTVLMAVLWLLATLALVVALPARPLWALLPWGLASLWFTGLSLWRTLERA